MSTRETNPTPLRPLPWHVQESRFGFNDLIYDRDGHLVATVGGTRDEAEEIHTLSAQIVRVVNQYANLISVLMACEQELTIQHAYVASASPMAREGRRARIAAVMDEVRATLAAATGQADADPVEQR
jgi:hypothetical protein